MNSSLLELLLLADPPESESEPDLDLDLLDSFFFFLLRSPSDLSCKCRGLINQVELSYKLDFGKFVLNSAANPVEFDEIQLES